MIMDQPYRGAAPRGEPQPRGERAADALARAETLARDEIAAAASGHDEFRLATDLAGAFHAAGTRLARFRGRAARRIREQEKLSLRSLARLTGVSKSRLDQLEKEDSSRE